MNQFSAGDIISYQAMCEAERPPHRGTTPRLQAGMYYRLLGCRTVVLMSVRPDAPYADHVEEGGRVLEYEGHNRPRAEGEPSPKLVDQPMVTPKGTLTQNGRFWKAAEEFGQGLRECERVTVYEKIRSGIWSFNGVFDLVGARQVSENGRTVFKFRLELALGETEPGTSNPLPDLEHARMIPTDVKQEVWRRDKGRCVQCGSADNLHFDHIIPFSKGGSSLVAVNIQLLCARHNLAKRDRIE